MSHDGIQDAQETEERLPSSIPAMPAVPRSQLYRGRPRLLAETGVRHSLGWQDHRQAGPSFVVVRLSRFDRVKVISRFPFTDQGWESAWRGLSDLDADAATAIGSRLATMQARSDVTTALVALDANTVRCLRRMTYSGGSGDSGSGDSGSGDSGSGDPLLTQGRAYDLRFLGDRLVVCPSASATALVELPYHDVEAVEVSGSDHGQSPSQSLAVILGLGLLGALLGFVILGLLGLLLGAMLCGLIAALATAGSTNVKTTVQLRGRNVEFFLVTTEKAPDAVRIELSAPLTAIAIARAAQQNGSGGPSERASDSIPDQISKLASLLADGVLSQAEFERLKAKVIAQS